MIKITSEVIGDKAEEMYILAITENEGEYPTFHICIGAEKDRLVNEFRTKGTLTFKKFDLGEVMKLNPKHVMIFKSEVEFMKHLKEEEIDV